MRLAFQATLYSWHAHKLIHACSVVFFTSNLSSICCNSNLANVGRRSSAIIHVRP